MSTYLKPGTILCVPHPWTVSILFTSCVSPHVTSQSPSDLGTITPAFRKFNHTQQVMNWDSYLAAWLELSASTLHASPKMTETHQRAWLTCIYSTFFLVGGSGVLNLGPWQALYYLSHAISPFSFSYFLDGVLNSCPGCPLTTILFSAPTQLRFIGICHHSWFVL
jgi:hypothetical protein